MSLYEVKPMMSNKEVKIIDDILTDLKPNHCLEWGAGGSTIYFPRKHKLNWLSVEHNGHWIQKIFMELPPHANVIWAPDNEWYVDCVKHSRIFDFILIDGLHRERCLEIAREIISPDGIILLHDAGREEYQDFIKKNDGEILIDGEEPYQGFYKHRGLALFRRKHGSS